MRLKTLLTLCRISNLPTVWMNVLTAALLATAAADGALPVGGMLVVMLAVSLLYCGGMSLNDWCDRRWDAEHQPFRPIPAGKASAATVGAMAAGLLAVGVALLLLTPYAGPGFLAGLVLLATIVAYDWLHKAHPGTVLLMATTRLLVFAVTAFALTGEADAIIWIVGGLQFSYTLLVTVVARYENSRGKPYGFPLIPRMIAGMALVDGAVLAIIISPVWLLVGAGAALLTRLAQRYVRGD